MKILTYVAALACLAVPVSVTADDSTGTDIPPDTDWLQVFCWSIPGVTNVLPMCDGVPPPDQPPGETTPPPPGG